jgi:hypothetical protein
VPATEREIWVEKDFCALALHPAPLDNSILKTQVNCVPTCYEKFCWTPGNFVWDK